MNIFLRHLASVGLFVAAAACSSPAVAPSPISPTPAPTPVPAVPTPNTQTPTFQHLAGIWTGSLKITEATFNDQIGNTLPFTLRIAGDRLYTGQFEIAEFPSHVNVAVAGGVRDDGFAVLSGTATYDAATVTTADVSELLIRTDEGTGLAGTVQFGQRDKGFNARYKAQILSASLQPSFAYPGGPFEGHWVGQAVVRACSGSCPPVLYGAGSIRDIHLILRQSQSTLSGRGTFKIGGCDGNCWLPLVGFAEGHSITSLNGQLREPFDRHSYGDYLMTLSDFSATVDDLGRMHARFVYSAETHDLDPRDYRKRIVVTSQLTMETVWLTRRR